MEELINTSEDSLLSAWRRKPANPAGRVGRGALNGRCRSSSREIRSTLLWSGRLGRKRSSQKLEGGGLWNTRLRSVDLQAIGTSSQCRSCRTRYSVHLD